MPAPPNRPKIVCKTTTILTELSSALSIDFAEAFSKSETKGGMFEHKVLYLESHVES